MSKNDITWLGNKVLNSDPIQTTQQTTQGESSMRRNTTDPATQTTQTTQTTQGGQTMFQQGPPPAMDYGYIAGYLSRNIGKNVKAEFLLGSNQFVDKTGILREVGINYFVLEDYISHALIMCDLYSVRFVTIL